MIDGVGLMIRKDRAVGLVEHPDLEWKGAYVHRTGEVHDRDPLVAKFGPDGCMTAKHYPPSGWTWIGGSLNKWMNKGSNVRDLTFSGASEAIEAFGEWLNVDPADITLRKAEFGVNFTPPTSTQYLTDRLVGNWRGTPCVPMRSGNGAALIGCELITADGRIKCYGKGEQLGLGQQLTRFEKVFGRSRQLQRDGVFNLGDLLKPGAWEQRAVDLCATVSGLVLVDPVFLTDPDLSNDPVFMAEIQNPNYSQNLKRTKRSTQRGRLELAIERNRSGSMTLQVQQCIKDQIQRLAA